jgi:hypothetical protein
LPKNNKSRRYQKRINEDYLKEVKTRVKPLTKIVQAKKGYTQWMRNFFLRGTIIERWKRIEEERWFDPSFQKFIYTTIVGAILNLIKNNNNNNKIQLALKDMWLSFYGCR